MDKPGRQHFAAFLRDNPAGKEVKRRRINAWFIADIGRELPEEAYRADVTPEEMSDWTLHHSEEDLPGIPGTGHLPGSSVREAIRRETPLGRQ